MIVSGLLSFCPLALLLSSAAGEGDGLNDLAVKAGLTYFGTATDLGEIGDTEFRRILNNRHHFSVVTPTNSLKWDTVEPQQGVFNFTKGQQLVDLVRENGQLLRCHALVWHQQLPRWLTSGQWTNETLIAVMKNHITTTVQYFGDACYAWDVVNEAFDESGNYQDSIFHRIIGPEFIPIALRTAAEAAAAAGVSPKLYLNDYNMVQGGMKAMAYKKLAADLLESDVPLDGMGFQGHMIMGSLPPKSMIKEAFNLFSALGLETAYTEMDVRLHLPITEAEKAGQATDYCNLIAACLETSKCIGITIWGFTDRYSWIPENFPEMGGALLWDENLMEKPAYYSAIQCLSDHINQTASASRRLL